MVVAIMCIKVQLTAILKLMMLLEVQLSGLGVSLVEL